MSRLSRLAFTSPASLFPSESITSYLQFDLARLKEPRWEEKVTSVVRIGWRAAKPARAMSISTACLQDVLVHCRQYRVAPVRVGVGPFDDLVHAPITADADIVLVEHADQYTGGRHVAICVTRRGLSVEFATLAEARGDEQCRFQRGRERSGLRASPENSGHPRPALAPLG